MEHGPYRVQVIPPVDTELPRTIVTIDVPAAGGPLVLSPVQISPPHDLLGTIRAGKPAVPVPGATVDFYAIDASGKQSVLIGSAVADSAGRYKVVLPDVSQPAGP
jgi:hypothetical protein